MKRQMHAVVFKAGLLGKVGDGNERTFQVALN